MEQQVYKWDNRFIALASHIAQWSKDPKIKVGAVIVNNNTVVGMGYNGFPRGVKDISERYNDHEMKKSFVVHAEINAILNSTVKNLEDCRMYVTPIFICPDCAKAVIQSGIKEVIVSQRRRDKYHASEIMFNEAGVKISWYE